MENGVKYQWKNSWNKIKNKILNVFIIKDIKLLFKFLNVFNDDDKEFLKISE